MKLDPAEAEIQGVRQGETQKGLGQPRHPHQERVSVGQECGESPSTTTSCPITRLATSARRVRVTSAALSRSFEIPVLDCRLTRDCHAFPVSPRLKPIRPRGGWTVGALWGQPTRCGPLRYPQGGGVGPRGLV